MTTATRGRPAAYAEALRLRGGRRRPALKPGAKPPKEKRIRPRPLGDLSAILKLIPNYDLYDGANGCHFDEAEATRAIHFVERLKHCKGESAGKRFLLEPWQQSIIANLWGWRRSDGTRRYRTAFIYVPRKNGKSSLAASLILLLLYADDERGAEIVGAASEYQQASLIFTYARGMIEQSPELLERSSIYKGQMKAVQLKDGYSTYRVVSREAASQHGGNLSGFVLDELHALDDSELLQVLETSVGARKQPLGIFITTADYQREGSPCNLMYDRACEIRDGVISDPSFLPVIYEASRDDDWTYPPWASQTADARPDISLKLLTSTDRLASLMTFRLSI